MLDIPALRSQFPALNIVREGRTPIFLDGPGGTQVPQQVIDAIVHYLRTCNANHGGAFRTSRESDAVVLAAHQAAADLINAPSAQEIIFGPNMTTLTFQLSRAIGRTLKPGDEVLVTRLDHDANISPWVLAARDAGADVKRVDIHLQDCTLDVDDYKKQLSPRTRMVALTCASNGVGTVNDVKRLGELAHDFGAWVFLDAVHYAPHGLIDVQEWGCDFLACSAYKFFGPHIGVLWGKGPLLAELPAYKVRPASNALPDRWMTGTQNHECLAGVTAAIDYIANIGSEDRSRSRRARLCSAMRSIQAYERGLADLLLDGLAQRPRFKVWGITKPDQRDRRVPTVSFSMSDRPAQAVAEHLASREIYVWSGNMYALELTERLGLEDKGGLLRIGLVHYNTMEEVDRLLAALDELN
ncbi:MAG: cysteine desulfurase-like protein [Gemmataceae bacterium]